LSFLHSWGASPYSVKSSAPWLHQLGGSFQTRQAPETAPRLGRAAVFGTLRRHAPARAAKATRRSQPSKGIRADICPNLRRKTLPAVSPRILPQRLARVAAPFERIRQFARAAATKDRCLEAGSSAPRSFAVLTDLSGDGPSSRAGVR